MNEVNYLINPMIAQNLNAIELFDTSQQPGLAQTTSVPHLPDRIPIQEWTKEEDEKLIELKQQQKPILTWKEISKYFPEKTFKQCHHRWYHTLAPPKPKPSVKLIREWTQEEDAKLIELKQQQESKLTWADIAKYFPERTEDQCTKRWICKLAPKPPSIKHEKWTQEEDEQLIKLIKQQEPILTWKEIAKYFPERTDQQCQQHWYKMLAPKSSIKYQNKHEKWTQEEDEQLIKLKRQQEPKLTWADIAKYFPERTDQQCQQHWHYALQPNPRRVKNKKRKLIEEENNDEHASKKLRTQHSDSSPELPLSQEDLSLTEEEL